MPRGGNCWGGKPWGGPFEKPWGGMPWGEKPPRRALPGVGTPELLRRLLRRLRGKARHFLVRLGLRRGRPRPRRCLLLGALQRCPAVVARPLDHCERIEIHVKELLLRPLADHFDESLPIFQR